MKGLEISERNLQNLERTLRIDAEYFQKNHLKLEEQLAQKKCETINRISNISDGNHFAISDFFVEDGIPYYRGQDVVGHFFIEQSAPNYITNEAFDRPYMKRSHLQQGDVLLSIIGTVGEASLVKTTQLATCSCKLAILRTNSIEPNYLAIYLASKIGRSLTERWKRGAVQTGLLLEDMDQLWVPRFPDNLEKYIVKIVDLAYHFLDSSRQSLTQAETSLIRALGLEDWQAPESLSYVRNSSEAFAAGRLDAEHFQEKFYAAKRKLLEVGAKRFIPIKELLLSITNGQTPKHHDLSIGEVPFLCAEHVRDFEINFQSEKRILLEHHTNELARTAIQPGDVLFTIKGRIGNAAIVDNIPGPVNMNQDVALLRFNQNLPLWYVVSYLNSYFGRLQSKKMATGAINPFLGLFSINQFEIPEFPSKITEVIASQTRANVVTAQQNKQRANQLLDAAKRAVEIAIEQDEVTALKYLEAYT